MNIKKPYVLTENFVPDKNIPVFYIFFYLESFIRSLFCTIFNEGFHVIWRGAMVTKYGKVAQNEVKKEMDAYKKGTAHSGTGGKKVTSKKQAIAIGLSKARKKGANVPDKKD